MIRIHGMSGTRFYGVWNDMMMRCYNPNKERFPCYGGRGIKVSARWRIFNNFYQDMYPTYAKGMSLERNNNNKGYNKSNCSWIPIKNQKFNKQNTIKLTIDGVTKLVPEWASTSGQNIFTIYQRIQKGWGHKDCVYGRGYKRANFAKSDIIKISNLSKSGLSMKKIGVIFNVSGPTIESYLKKAKRL